MDRKNEIFMKNAIYTYKSCLTVLLIAACAAHEKSPFCSVPNKVGVEAKTPKRVPTVQITKNTQRLVPRSVVNTHESNGELAAVEFAARRTNEVFKTM